MYNVDVKFENLSSEVHVIHQKLDKLNLVTPSSSMAAMTTNTSSPICFTDTICGFCGNFGHDSQDCTSTSEQIYASQAYKNNNVYSNTYNSATRSHPYLSYNSTNVQNPQVLTPHQQQI